MIRQDQSLVIFSDVKTILRFCEIYFYIYIKDSALYMPKCGGNSFEPIKQAILEASNYFRNLTYGTYDVNI